MSNPSPEQQRELQETLATGLEGLRSRVEDASTEAPSASVLLADLETAYEELRAADEELRVQGEELRVQGETIRDLVDGHRRLWARQERVLAIMPVAMIVTDRNGVMRSVNAATAVLADQRVGRMVGRPLVSLFTSDDRAEIRRMVSRRAQEEGVEHGSASLLPRLGHPVPVDIAAFGGASDDEDELSWILLPTSVRREGSPRLADCLASLALLPRRASSVHDLLEPAVVLCQEALGSDAAVSVALGSPLAPDAVASTSQLAQTWDGAQLAAGAGPSVTAFQESETVLSLDVHADERWEALRTWLPEGVSVMATPVESSGHVVGCLTVYGRPEQPLPEETLELLALTLGGVLNELELISELGRLEQDMERALVSRAVIDQAKGVIMASQGVDERTAWEYLVRLSSTQHRKLRDIAQDIVTAVGGAIED